MNGRDYRITVFEDTRKKTKSKYSTEVSNSVATGKIYYPTKDLILKTTNYKSDILINKLRSFEAAENISDVCKNMKIAVLNFASAKNPGGMVMKGSSAQEEALCRVSTLYDVISDKRFWNHFYGYHRAKNDTLYTDRLIYTKDIVVFKDDDFEDFYKPYKFDVITCAAPNLRETKISDQQLFDIHYERCMNILRAAADNDVEILVLGAFGCGAFMNDPKVVSKAMKKAIEDCPYKFFKVIFPIFCREWETENFDAFNATFKGK